MRYDYEMAINQCNTLDRRRDARFETVDALTEWILEGRLG